MEAVPLWEQLRQAVGHAQGSGPGVWTWLKQKMDPAGYTPEAVHGVEVRQLHDREGEYFVLKNTDIRTYYRLGERDHFLWQLMDGTQTVKDLVIAYFQRYGALAFARVATLVAGLRASLFLTDQPVDVLLQVRRGLERRRLSHRLAQVRQLFVEKQFAISGLDRWLGRTYRWGGWVLFTWPTQLLCLGVTLAGLYCFARAYSAGRYGLVIIAGSYRVGIISLIAANLGSILVHEAAHGLTVKRFGREVRRGGFMIYFGMPAFFVDTTDIWMEGKWARLAVTWAGPYSGLILGGLASLVLSLSPAFGLNPLLYQFAFLSYLTVFLNLNPLLELDGYYVLIDWLEIPMLRQRSLEFVRAGLWTRLDALRKDWPGLRPAIASFSTEEWVFSIFGLLSGGWTAYAILAGARFWQDELAGALRGLWARGGGLGRILMALVGVAISLPFVVSIGLYLLGLARKALGWASRRGLLAGRWGPAAVMLAVVAGAAAAPQLLGYAALAPAVRVLAPAAGAYLAWRAAADYSGSRSAPAFGLLGLSLASLLLAEVGVVAVQVRALPAAAFHPLVTALRTLSGASLVIASLLLFADMDLKELHLAEKVLLALGFLASYGLVLRAGMERPLSPSDPLALLDVAISLSFLLALTLLVPTLFSFWRTRFGPAWLALWLGMGGLLATGLAGSPPTVPCLLMAAGLLLHQIARTQPGARTREPAGTLDASDQRRLQRAFSSTAGTVLDRLRDGAGERRARMVAERFTDHSLAAGWAIRLVKGEVEDSLPRDLGLIQRGDTYGAALTLLLDLAQQRMGEKLTVRALQSAYDSLPWEEREVAAQYLFRNVPQAQTLSREFQAAHQSLRALLQRMPLFATMDEAEIDLLCAELRAERYSAGQVIIRQGDRGDTFYVVRRGHVAVTVRDERGVSQVVNRLGRGDYFGELALLRDAPRNATCKATVPTEVLRLHRQDFDRLVKDRFDLREKVGRSVARVDLLRRMPLFSELNSQQIQRIATHLREEAYEPGAVIIRQGEIGEAFYVIESGRVQASVAHTGGENVIAERGPGEYVGEIALLLAVPRTATVRALVPTRVLVLHKDDFDRLVAEHLYVSRSLERESSRRMIDLRRAASTS